MQGIAAGSVSGKPPHGLQPASDSWKIYSESLTINTNLPMKQNEEIFRERLRQSRGFPNRVCETNNILTLKTREKQ